MVSNMVGKRKISYSAEKAYAQKSIINTFYECQYDPNFKLWFIIITSHAKKITY